MSKKSDIKIDMFDFWRFNKKYISINEYKYDVYFVTDGQFVKIGYAKDMYYRLSSIQTGNPRKCSVMFTIPVKDEVDAKTLEHSLHALFWQYRLCREWFDILELIEDSNWISTFSKIQEDAAIERSRTSNATMIRIIRSYMKGAKQAT